MTSIRAFFSQNWGTFSNFQNKVGEVGEVGEAPLGEAPLGSVTPMLLKTIGTTTLGQFVWTCFSWLGTCFCTLD